MSESDVKEETKHAIIPFDQIKQMAQALGVKKLFGKTAEELLPLMLIAQAEGMHPAIAAQEYDIIMGKPAINSRAALSRFQRSGGKIGWKVRSDEKAEAVFDHPACINPVTITWTMERAAKAGLTGKDNWKKIPAQMLAARVVAEGVRACYPACLSGMYTVEEVQDIPEIRNVTEKAETEEKPRLADQPLDFQVEEYIKVALKRGHITDTQAAQYREEAADDRSDGHLQGMLKRIADLAKAKTESIDAAAEAGFSLTDDEIKKL